MRFSVLAALAATAFAAAPTIPPVDVSGTLRQVPVALIMAYDSGCEACILSKPEFEEVESDVPTYLVEASEAEAQAFRDEYGITSFPAFMLLEHGSLTEMYEGERSRAAFEAYLSAKTAPPAPEVVTSEL